MHLVGLYRNITAREGIMQQLWQDKQSGQDQVKEDMHHCRECLLQQMPEH